MAVDVTDFTTTPASDGDKVVYPDGTKTINGTLLDYSVSGQYHTEPIYEIGNEQVKAYENYKQADQYTGHAVRQNPDFSNVGGNNISNLAFTPCSGNGGNTGKCYYVIEENGAHYASGKTYYLGYETLLVPNI